MRRPASGRLVPALPGRADGATITEHQGHERIHQHLKTWALLAALGGLLVFVGGLLGGRSGMVLALVFASR